ncbi:MAG: coenzyme F420-0:L-glutamate ligase [Chloroflexaceae bacterium]|nr:coenzyme F420-0:L-glutamate ligase [Chloroflexaceae bacterium]
MVSELRIFPIRGLGDIHPGDDLTTLLLAAMAQHDQQFETGDVLVVTQKIVSKAEGRLVDLATITPSPFAEQIAAEGRKSAAYYEVVLRESRRIVRMVRGVLITETHHGFICANAGVDDSNVAGDTIVSLLPIDSDRSAATLRAAIAERCGVQVAVLISDSFGRPWREGQVNFAIGVAGLDPIRNYAGLRDPHGYELQASVLAVADELAAAAELVMNKVDMIPAAVVRGYPFEQVDDPTVGSMRRLLRDPNFDMFR